MSVVLGSVVQNASPWVISWPVGLLTDAALLLYSLYSLLPAKTSSRRRSREISRSRLRWCFPSGVHVLFLQAVPNASGRPYRSPESPDTPVPMLLGSG